MFPNSKANPYRCNLDRSPGSELGTGPATRATGIRLEWWNFLELKIHHTVIVLHSPGEDEIPSMVCPLAGSASTLPVRLRASEGDPRRGSKRCMVRLFECHCWTGARWSVVSAAHRNKRLQTNPGIAARANGAGSRLLQRRRGWGVGSVIESVRTWMDAGNVIVVLSSARLFPIRQETIYGALCLRWQSPCRHERRWQHCRMVTCSTPHVRRRSHSQGWRAGCTHSADREL